MSGSGWNVLGGKRTPDRRSSSSGQVSSSQAAAAAAGVRIDHQKRPLMSMLSEDGSRYSTNPADSGHVRQSFLSKLTTRSDSKPSSSINTINENHPQPQQHHPRKPINQGGGSSPQQAAEMIDNNNNNNNTNELSSSQTTINQQHGTECDNNYDDSKPKNDLEQIKQADSKSINTNNHNHHKIEEGNDYTDGPREDKPGDRKSAGEEKENAEEKKENNIDDGDDDDDDDDDNQVIPSWPSKSDAASKTINSEFIQHKVYSLKDYSQVASPTVPQPINYHHNHHHPQSTSETNNNKQLNKSLSQDRKIKANTKRLSECLYLSSAASSHPPLLISLSPHQNEQSPLPPSLTAALDDHRTHQKQPNPSNSMGRHESATSGGGPLPNHAALLGESRIDRMRKLFVSPMSLRSTSGSGLNHGGKGGGSAAALRGASHQQRLSFQSGASSMLNKPQHLMHAMYRTGGFSHNHGGSGASGSGRRSPSRSQQQQHQEQANKSFRVYGCPLQMANNIYPITCFGRADIYKQQSVPYVLARLCNYIEENSSHLTHEGIFRVSGNARLMVKLRTLFDHLGDAPLESESVDVATSASMLKMYLRELPEPLIPTRMNYYFITLAKKYSLFLAKDNSQSISGYRQPHATLTSVIPSNTVNNTPTTTTSETTSTSSETHTQQTQNAKERQMLAFSRDLTKLVRKLPIENYNLLKYLACFLYRISLKQQYNKMCAEALGIVFGPNIFRIRNESYKGLKEQELSNQIMASIISNYRSIFDSDITDPLGNLVLEPNDDNDGTPEVGEHDELLMRVVAAAAVSAADPSTVTDGTTPTSTSGSKGKASTTMVDGDTSGTTRQPPVESMGSSSRTGNLESTTAATTIAISSIATISPRPSTSKGACCPVHCGQQHPLETDDIIRPKGSHVAAHSELRVCDLVGDEDDDYDEEDCDDEDESYTPSSNSDSYCSSMGSETIETSSCANNDDDDDDEEDEDDDEYFAGEHVKNGDIASPRSSSECASDTSYTPTSSHTDSDGIPDDEADEADESLYGENSSSFESSLSTGGGGGGNASTRKRGSSREQQPQTTCRVCERRVSAHLDRMANGELISRVCDDSTTTTGRTRAIVSVQQIEEIPETDNDVPTPVEAAPVDDGAAAAQDIDKEEKTTTKEAPKLGIGGGRLPAGSHSKRPLKSGNRLLDFARRRSSSASSLGRVRQRTSRIPHQTTTAIATPTRATQHGARVADWRQHPAARSNRGASERSSRVRHSSSSRRPKGRGHSMRRAVLAGNDTRTGSSRDGTSHVRGGGFSRTGGGGGGGEARCSRRRSDRRQKQQQKQVMQMPTRHHVSSHEVNYGDHWLPEAPRGGESYFLLRSFNSDETLLRSFDCNNQARSEINYARNRPRRFSGIDPQSSTLASACVPLPLSRPIDQIFEEDRMMIHHLPDGDDDEDDRLPPAPVSVEQSPFVGASFVSLLDHKLIGFRKSDVSIDEEEPLAEPPGHPSPNRKRNHDDCIWVQVRATKELIKAMRLLQRLSNSCDYTADMEELVRKLSSEPHGYSDDCTACEVDYLSALSLIGQIEGHLSSTGASSSVEPTIEAMATMKQMDYILSEKINLLRQRQADLRAIRDHYWRIHGGGRRSCRRHRCPGEGPQNTRDGSQMGAIRSKSETGIHRSSLGGATSVYDGQGSSNNTTTTTTAITAAAAARIGRSRKLSAPNKQETTQGVSCSSSASSLAGDPTRSRLAQVGSDGWPARVRAGPATSRVVSSQGPQSNCRFGSLCPIEFVFNIERQLAIKRSQGARMVKLNEMTMDQLMSEKLELQKNLLRYEHWFGRPSSRLEFSLVGHIYERYRAVKMIKLNRDHENEREQEGDN